MLVSEIISAVRPQVNDTDATDEMWDDDTHFVPACAFAQRFIVGQCPTALLDADGNDTRDATTIDATTSSFVFLDSQEHLYFDAVCALVQHWLWQCEAGDSPDVAKSQHFMKMALIYLGVSNG